MVSQFVLCMGLIEKTAATIKIIDIDTTTAFVWHMSDFFWKILWSGEKR